MSDDKLESADKTKQGLCGVGCMERICVTHPVCSCIEVPLAVSGGRMHGVVYCILLHQGDLSGVGCAERIFCHACCVFLHQGALSGIGWKDTWHVWCIVCSCIKMFVRHGILCASCIKVSLTVSGALDVCCMYAVCSCISVPLAVSGVRIHRMCGVLYALASKCL